MRLIIMHEGLREQFAIKAPRRQKGRWQLLILLRWLGNLFPVALWFHYFTSCWLINNTEKKREKLKFEVCGSLLCGPSEMFHKLLNLFPVIFRNSSRMSVGKMDLQTVDAIKLILFNSTLYGKWCIVFCIPISLPHFLGFPSEKWSTASALYLFSPFSNCK